MMVRCLWLWLIPFQQSLWQPPFAAGRNPIRNRPRIDKEWSETIERLEIDYDEKGRFPGHLVTKGYSRRNRWDLVGHYEVPYYAILYTNITVEGIPSPTGEIQTNVFVTTRPGSACGGILVNQRQVLTTCGCLYSWWRWLLYKTLTEAEKRVFNAEPQIFGYSMYSKHQHYTVDKDTFIPTIYLSHSQVFFAPDFTHTIENDWSKHTAQWLNCSSWEEGVHFQPTELIYGLVLANFQPDIQDLDLSSFIPWPPVPIANVTRYNRLKPVAADSVAVYPTTGIRARIVGMGFKGEGVFTDDLGNAIIEEDSMVDAETEVIPLQECISRFESLKKLKAYVKSYVVCLKGVVDGDGFYSVADGLPGNPVLTGFGSLAGMVMDVQSKGVGRHYYVMLNFIGGLQYKIENENNKFLLERQKIVRAPLYREGGWQRIFLQYTVPPKEEEEASVPEPESAAPPTLLLLANSQTHSLFVLALSLLF